MPVLALELPRTPEDFVKKQPLWLAFLRANQVDPHDAVATIDGEPLAVFVDEDAETFTFTSYVRDPEGNKARAASDRRLLKQTRTVPLLSHPSRHGLVPTDD